MKVDKRLIKKIARKARKFAFWSALATAPLWPYWITAPTELVRKMWPNIESTKDAYRILEEEKKKLGIRDKITLRVHEGNELREVYADGYTGINKGGEGFVIGANRSALDRILLRHELYHIKRDGEFIIDGGENAREDLEILRRQRGEPSPLKLLYFYEMEPTANIYSVTGLRF